MWRIRTNSGAAMELLDENNIDINETNDGEILIDDEDFETVKAILAQNGINFAVTE